MRLWRSRFDYRRSHYRRSRDRQPKYIILYPGCCHGLDECRQEVDKNLLDWLRDKLGYKARDRETLTK